MTEELSLQNAPQTQKAGFGGEGSTALACSSGCNALVSLVFATDAGRVTQHKVGRRLTYLLPTVSTLCRTGPSSLDWR
jgi:hypothetical protein